MINRLQRRLRGEKAVPTVGCRVDSSRVDDFAHGRLRILHGSAVDPAVDLGLETVDAIVGNLPYSISSSFLKRLVMFQGRGDASSSGSSSSSSAPRWHTAAFLVQDEFALKVTAKPSGKDGGAGKRGKGTNIRGGGVGLRGGSTKPYGALAALVGAVAEAEAGGAVVPPEAFDPPPKVNSRVVRLTAHRRRGATGTHAGPAAAGTGAPLLVAGGEVEAYADFLRLCFATKRRSLRKTLLASGVLRRLGGGGGGAGGAAAEAERLRGVLDSPGLEGIACLRATEAGVADLASLFKAIRAAGLVLPKTTSTPVNSRRAVEGKGAGVLK